MKKVLLVLLLFGMIFGGVYGEFYSGTYGVEKKYQFEISNTDITIVDGGKGTYSVYSDDSIYRNPELITDDLFLNELETNGNPTIADIIQAVEVKYKSKVVLGNVQVLEFDNGKVLSIKEANYNNNDQNNALTYGDVRIPLTPCMSTPPYTCSNNIDESKGVQSHESQTPEVIEITPQELSDLESARAEANRYRQEQKIINERDKQINAELKEIEEDLKVPTLDDSQRRALISRKTELNSQLSINIQKSEQLKLDEQKANALAAEKQKKLESLKILCETSGCSSSEQSAVKIGLESNLISSEKLIIENGKLFLKTKEIPGIPGKYYLEEVKPLNFIDNGYNTEEEIANLANNYASATDSEKVQIENYLNSNPGLETAKIAYLKATGKNLGINNDILNSFSTSFILSISEKNKDFAISALISKGGFEVESVDTLKRVMELGNDELNKIVILSAIAKDDDLSLENTKNKDVEGYKNKPTDNFATLCSGNLNCLNTVDSLQENDIVKTQFIAKMESGKIKYTEDDFARFLAQENNGLSPEDFQNLVEAANTGNCQESNWGQTICGWLNNIDATELQVKQFGDDIDNLLKEIEITKTIDIGYTNAQVSCSGDTEEECISKIEDECKRITSSQDEEDTCVNSGSRALLDSSIYDYASINEEILSKLVLEYNLCDGKSESCEADILGVCNTDITSSACNDAIKDLCTDGSPACDAYDGLARKMRQEGFTETSTAFDVIAALMNPDQNALLASELFGFESDFSDLPEWLTEDTASLICLAKIDGYLDTQVESQFEDSAGNSGARGITQYGCSLEDGLEFDPNTGTYQPTVGLPCVEVLADLRAERTPLLPNGEVQITYSYYLKSPPNVNISYMLYAAYNLENQSKTELQPLFLHRNDSLDIRVLEAGEDISDFRVARIPENGTLVTPIGDESIKLLLQAFYTDGSTIQEYVSIISPAYPIEVGSYRDPLGQQSSSSSGGESTSGENTGSQEDEQSEGVDDEDIRNNACQLMGTC